MSGRNTEQAREDDCDEDDGTHDGGGDIVEVMLVKIQEAICFSNGRVERMRCWVM